MARLPYVKPSRARLPRKPFDAEDPRALDLLRPWKAGERYDTVLLGVPFDGAVLGRKGARFGPDAIREAFRYDSTFDVETSTPLWDRLRVADAGNVEPARTTKAMHDRVTAAVAALLDTGAVPIVLGGDNSLSFASARALVNRRGRMGLVVLDAHADLRPVKGGVVGSGTPYRRVIEELDVPGKRVFEIGLKPWANAEALVAWGKGRGVTMVTARDALGEGPVAVMERALEHVSREADAVFVSVDLDVLDQADAPGVSAPTPGGLRAPDLFTMVRRAAAFKKVAAFDIVETAPKLDPTGNTARVAATTVMHAFAGLASRSR